MGHPYGADGASTFDDNSTPSDACGRRRIPDQEGGGVAMTAAQIVQVLRSAAEHSPALALITSGTPAEIKVVIVVWVACLVESRARRWYLLRKMKKKDAIRALEIEAGNDRRRKPPPDDPP